MRYRLTPVRYARVSFAAGALALFFVFWGPLGLTGKALAGLPPGCSQSGSTVSCSYSYTGTEQSLAVPAGVSSVGIAAVGGAGGNGGDPGGLGGTASGSVSVAPGSTLYIEVGGAGAPAGTGTGGFNGGGTGPGIYNEGAAGGGGASDVRTVSCAVSGCPGSSASLASRLIVAAGGGGSAPYGVDPYGNFLGGTGGAAGSPGADGVAIELANVGKGGGGGAGTSTSGGTGGTGGGVYFEGTPGDPGMAGVFGQGGAGGASGTAGTGGGGGGGGYYGGGGGGGANDGSGGGGGGGSSWVTSSATGAGTGIASSGVPASVTISYTAAPVGCTMTSTSNSTAFSSSGQSIHIENGLSSDISQSQHLVLRSLGGPAHFFSLTSGKLTDASCIDNKTQPLGPGDQFNTFAGDGTGVYGTSYGTSTPGYKIRIEIGDYGEGTRPPTTSADSVVFTVTNSSGTVVWTGRGTLTSGSETESG